MTARELIEILSKQDPDSYVHIRYCDVKYGTVDGDEDYICFDDVDIYTDKQNVIIDMRKPQMGY
jgi:hypothetical protein